MHNTHEAEALLAPDEGRQLKYFRDVLKLKHKPSSVNIIYLSVTHLLAVLSFLAFSYAPEGFWLPMCIYLVAHVSLAVFSTTAYAHRMVAHRATKSISWPVHLFFGYIGQTLAVQGSLLEWAGRHRTHHAVDGNRKHHTDPYSAVWFESQWRNFLWSHVLCYFFEHPETEGDFAVRIKNIRAQHKVMGLQHRYYVGFLIALIYALPFGIGVWVGGSVWAGLCLVWTSVLATVVIQNVTWTVNSFTHLWGLRAARSSARNNYVWMLPMGEGNHHADHHDAPTDYRNGFGWLGWILDPTRYLLLALRALRLIGPLQRTPKSVELKIIAERRMQRMAGRFARRLPMERWQPFEAKLLQLKTALLEQARRVDALKREHARLISARSKMTQAQLQTQLNAVKLKAGHAKNELQYAYRNFMLELKSARYALKLKTAS